MTTGLRVRNQYLLSILSLATQLGEQNVSTQLLVEAWKGHGRACDENFFMHFDVLSEYKFLTASSKDEQVLSLDEVLRFGGEQDQFVSVTHAGREFLDRYGGR